MLFGFKFLKESHILIKKLSFCFYSSHLQSILYSFIGIYLSSRIIRTHPLEHACLIASCVHPPVGGIRKRAKAEGSDLDAE